MKKYIYLLTIVLGLLFLQTNVTAQKTRGVFAKKKAPIRSNKVYLKTDELFKSIAARELKAIDETTLKNFGQSVEKDLSTETKPEKTAASLLILLQDKPNDVIVKYSDANATNQQKALRANELITEFTKKLIRDSRGGANDPLEEYINELESFEGQELLNKDLNERLGKGVEREEKAAILLGEIRNDFSRESLQQMRVPLKVSKETARLPYPLCLIKKPCPR